MTIQWYGQSCFKISLGGAQSATALIEPFGKETGLTPPRLKPDVLILSREVNKDMISEAAKEGIFLIAGPGEYEVKNIGVTGFPVQSDKKPLNVIYRLDIEGVALCHLNHVAKPEISKETLEAIGEVDVLFVPAGEKKTWEPEDAVKIINQLSPKIVVPMNYKVPGLKVQAEPVEKFLKAMGMGAVEAKEKLTLKKKDIPEKMEVVVLKP